MKLIVGLGNPGKRYQNTRHNLGFMVLDKLGLKWSLKKRFQTEISELKDGVILAKPQTMMNASGLAVAKLANYYRILPTGIWVVHDDLDLPLGQIKIQKGRGAAGHKGVASIIKELGTKEFNRVRLGIGRPAKGEDSDEDYVLSVFEKEEKSEVEKMVKKAGEIIRQDLIPSLT